MYLPVHKDPRGGHNRVRVNQDFFKYWSPSMAYVLGFIIADGAIEDVQKSSRACYIAIVSKDRSILEAIKEVLNSWHKLYERVGTMCTYRGKVFKPGKVFVLRIGSKIMYNNLLKLGVTPRKSLTILFPAIPTEYLSFFVRGYFDGDGCIHLKKKKYPIVIFTSGSLKFLEGLNCVISRKLNIPLASIVANNSGFSLAFQLRYSVSLSKRVLEFMYGDLDKAPYLDRKFKIYQQYLELSHA